MGCPGVLLRGASRERRFGGACRTRLGPNRRSTVRPRPPAGPPGKRPQIEGSIVDGGRGQSVDLRFGPVRVQRAGGGRAGGRRIGLPPPALFSIARPLARHPPACPPARRTRNGPNRRSTDWPRPPSTAVLPIRGRLLGGPAGGRGRTVDLRFGPGRVRQAPPNRCVLTHFQRQTPR